MKSILIAFQFLTQLPIRINQMSPKDLAGSMTYFPLVAVFISFLLILIRVELAMVSMPSVISAAILILVLVIITGALHLDGLADTCDGFYAGEAKRSPDESRVKTKERILSVMSDSKIGAMGVVGITMTLLFKYSILMVVLDKLPLYNQYICLAVPIIVSRWSMVIAASISGAAKSDGKANPFIENLRIKHWLTATIITYLIVIGILRMNGFIFCMVGLGVVVIFVFYIKRRIGGLTGDTLGAICEVTEVAVLLSTYFIYR